MLKNLILIAASIFLLASCGGEGGSDATVTEVTIADFNANAEAYEDQVIAVVGTVDHVCRHGGKKMFIVGETPEDRVKIEAGDGAFEVSLEGSRVRVEGKPIILKIDEAYIDNLESEAKAAHDDAHHEGEEHAHEGDAQQKQIDNLREELESCAAEYIPVYTIECIKFEELAGE